MLKIKVNLDNHSYNNLVNDMRMFNVIKKDSSINKNKFINLLFENLYEDYISNINLIKNKSKSILNKYNVKDDSLLSELSVSLFEFNSTNNESYYNKSLIFYLNDKNEMIFNDLVDTLKYESYSLFFRKLIYHYLSFPQYKRDQIIHKEVFDLLNRGINESKIVKVKLINNKVEELLPYKLDTSKEEVYTYVIGKVRKTEITSIKLSKIKSVFLTSNIFKFSKGEISLFEEIIKCGIQFPCNELTDAEIILSERGVELFNRKFLNKPTPIKIEGNHYFFRCSYNQLFVFFISFAKHIDIISPESLRKDFINMYTPFIKKKSQ